MPIGEQVTIASHTGNGVATVFAYSFGVLAADDLKVLVNGVEVTTGFTVSGIGSRTGGTVTFSTAPTSGAAILIVREVVRKRDTDYQYSGDLREEVLDDDFDRIWMTLQEDGELVDRGVRVPVGETLSELPVAASRVDKVLTFGAGGAIALVDIAAFTGGGIVELVPADGSIALVKLTAAVQSLINGALQQSGGTMLADIILAGNTAQDLGAVPKQQAESIAEAAAEAASTAAVINRMRYLQVASQPTTSGTAVDFSSIPSWAKRITVLLRGVSTSGTSHLLIQLGSGSLVTSGYVDAITGVTYGTNGGADAVPYGIPLHHSQAAQAATGAVVLSNIGGDAWQAFGSLSNVGGTNVQGVTTAGSITLSGVLDRIRLTSVAGDTFDAGGVALLIEG